MSGEGLERQANMTPTNRIKSNPTEAQAHTPLPWYAKKNPKLSAVRAESDGEYIAEMIGSYANAAFIVRACNSHYELLEALEELTYVRNARTLRQARAAIERAS